MAASAATEWEPVIGLEIHVQLSTKTKMFCGCELSFGDEPNVHTCPVCLGHPGTLPTVNEQAIHYGLMIAHALECEISPVSEFARKNYFYPDLPKGYQISQFDLPLAGRGEFGGVGITRAHLEEDAAKLTHTGGSGRIHGSGASLVDFNRGGTPLVEIVTEPDIRSAAQAREFAQLLRATLRRLGVSDVNMEEGSLRVDGNISLRPAGSDTLGTKTELKNMNSFRFLERGIEAELERQRGMLDAGRGRRAGDAPLRPLRRVADAAALEGVLARLPLLPRARPGPGRPDRGDDRRRPRRAPRAARRAPRPLHGRGRHPRGGGYDLRLPGGLGRLLRARARRGARAEPPGASPKAIANWISGELVAGLRQGGEEGDPLASKATPEAVAALAALVEQKTVSHGAGKQVLAKLIAEGGDPAAIVESEGLAQISDSGELESVVEAAIEAEPEAAEAVRGGNAKAAGRIMGRVMKETQGRADGGEVNRMILEKLG